MPAPQLKPKVCKVCELEYQPRKRMQTVCSLPCSIEQSRRNRQADAIKKMQKRMAGKTRKPRKPDTPREKAQKAVNAYIRARDHDKPCIVHGHFCPNANGGWDAGHYLTRGANPELAFNLLNIHKQCRTGNRGSHKHSKYQRGQSDMYRQNLIERIGLDNVERLEGPHKPKQYRDEDYKRIARIFRKRARYYERRNQER